MKRKLSPFPELRQIYQNHLLRRRRHTQRLFEFSTPHLLAQIMNTENHFTTLLMLGEHRVFICHAARLFRLLDAMDLQERFDGVSA